MLANTYAHNAIHNELINSGWSNVKSNSLNTYVYRHLGDISRSNPLSVSNPYAEFILSYPSAKEVSLTVPIPFQGGSLAYKNTFKIAENIDDILAYLKIHLANYV
jgi:hypothetical protein